MLLFISKYVAYIISYYILLYVIVLYHDFLSCFTLHHVITLVYCIRSVAAVVSSVLSILLHYIMLYHIMLYCVELYHTISYL